MAECNQNKNCVHKRPTEFEQQPTVANAHLMESLLDNWLKNNHITVDIIIIYFGTVCLYLGSFSSFLNCKETPFSFWHQKY